MLLEERANAQAYGSIATALSPMAGCSCPALIHTIIQQRPPTHLSSTIPLMCNATLAGKKFLNCDRNLKP